MKTKIRRHKKREQERKNKKLVEDQKTVMQEIVNAMINYYFEMGFTHPEPVGEPGVSGVKGDTQ